MIFSDSLIWLRRLNLVMTSLELAFVVMTHVGVQDSQQGKLFNCGVVLKLVPGRDSVDQFSLRLQVSNFLVYAEVVCRGRLLQVPLTAHNGHSLAI